MLVVLDIFVYYLCHLIFSFIFESHSLHLWKIEYESELNI